MARQIVLALVGCAVLHAGGATSADLPPDVLAKSGRVTITRADFDAELAGVPANLRDEFAMSNERLSKLLNTMLESRTLAAEARASGLDKDPMVQARVAAQIDRTLAAARRDQIEREAAAAFERRRENFAGRAREIYLLDKDKYTLPPKVRAAHILIRTDKRGKDEALRLATQIHAKAIAPAADFGALAVEFSEDLNAKTNNGDLGWFEAKQMDRAFWRAASALKVPGEISEPALSSSGYHIIRLEDRKPAELQSFDAVRNQIMADIKRQYVDAAKIAALDGIFRDPTLQVNQPAIDGLAIRIDPEALRNAGAAVPQ